MKRRLVISITCALIVLNALSPMVSATVPAYIFGREEATITTNPGTISVTADLIHWKMFDPGAGNANPAWVLEQQDPKWYSMVWDPRPVLQGGDGASIDMWIEVEIKDLCSGSPQDIAYDIEFIVYDVEDDQYVAQHHIQQPDFPDWTSFDGNQGETYYLQANIGAVVDGEKYDVRLVINFQGDGLTGDDETTEGELFIQTP